MKNKYRRKQIWCSKCDQEIVEVGKKCDYCRNREYASKIKKPSKHQLLNDL